MRKSCFLLHFHTLNTFSIFYLHDAPMLPGVRRTKGTYNTKGMRGPGTMSENKYNISESWQSNLIQYTTETTLIPSITCTNTKGIYGLQYCEWAANDKSNK